MGQHRDTVFAVHPHTGTQPTTVARTYWPWSSSQARRRPAEGGYERTNRVRSARAPSQHGFSVDRGLTADLLGFSAPTGDLRKHRDVDYLLSASAPRYLSGSDGSRRTCSCGAHPSSRMCGSAAASSIEQHHAAEAQSGRDQARALWQQGVQFRHRRSDERAQYAVQRYRRHRRRRSARALDVSRCGAHGEAGGRVLASAVSTPDVWRRRPQTAGRR